MHEMPIARLHGGKHDGLVHEHRAALTDRKPGRRIAARAALERALFEPPAVEATVEHLVAHLPSGRPERLLLLTDCMSPVAGFEHLEDALFERAREAGTLVLTLAELPALIHSERGNLPAPA